VEVLTGSPGTLTGVDLVCIDRQATCSDAEQEAGPGTCVCRPAHFGTPMFDVASSSWDNPCSTNAVHLASKLHLTGTTADVMNQPAKKAAFAAAVADVIHQQSGTKVNVIEVVAVDVSDGGRRHARRLQASTVHVSFKVTKRRGHSF
jgi:hypothetical protein